ncbi:hypothetical protein L596_030684 [Steinernema carpocapsae]|uniref:Uncharacterized protein n=1 Tax=Steinernema carpocapsae TaxID=34508 RepID=A0A4U5LQ29_STECR|nr:hypothetical protein L596_030684 [Steinernema carpocapsae]
MSNLPLDPKLARLVLLGWSRGFNMLGIACLISVWPIFKLNAVTARTKVTEDFGSFGGDLMLLHEMWNTFFNHQQRQHFCRCYKIEPKSLDAALALYESTKKKLVALNISFGAADTQGLVQHIGEIAQKAWPQNFAVLQEDGSYRSRCGTHSLNSYSTLKKYKQQPKLIMFYQVLNTADSSGYIWVTPVADVLANVEIIDDVIADFFKAQKML